MSQAASGVSNGSGAAAVSASGAGGFANVDMDEFLKLLIAQMQNQDPLSQLSIRCSWDKTCRRRAA
jgi:flagellar hook assembly protein FlgD